MTKQNDSYFESLESIIKSIDFNYSPEKVDNKEIIRTMWNETVGNKIAEMTYVTDISKDILKISCCDSYVANELYTEKDKILKILALKTEKTGIKILDIKFDYKTWKN